MCLYVELSLACAIGKEEAQLLMEVVDIKSVLPR